MTISIEELRKSAATATRCGSDERERAKKSRVEANRLVLESEDAVCSLFLAARFKSRIGGFPDLIDMSSANGYMKGAYLKYSGDSWRVEAPEHWPGQGHFDGYLSSMVAKAMSAMQIPHSQEAHATVTRSVEWTSGRLAEDLREAVSHLAPHTVAGLFGLGYRCENMFPTGWVRSDLPEALARAAVSLGVDYNSPAVEGRQSPAVRLCTKLNSSYLEAAIRIAGARPGSEGLLVAASGLCGPAVELVLRTGVDPGYADTAGYTALHHAAVGVRYGDWERGVRTARLLLSLGAPAGARNRHNDTAGAMVREAVRALEGGDAGQAEALEDLADELESRE